MKSQGKTGGDNNDIYSREALFRNPPRRKKGRSFAGDASNNMGSLSSRFGPSKVSGGSMF